MMAVGRDISEHLIEAFRNFHCLWKVSCKAYKDLTARENAWKTVALETGGTTEQCSKKWKSLRDKYVRELKKINKPVSGDPGPRPTSSWPQLSTESESSYVYVICMTTIYSIYIY